MHVHRDAPDAFTLLLDPEPAPDGVAVISAHHVSEDAEVIGPEPIEVLVVTGDPPDGDIVAPGTIPGTTEVLTDDPRALAVSMGCALSPPDALEPLRIAAGIPAIGVDDTAVTGTVTVPGFAVVSTPSMTTATARRLTFCVTLIRRS
jgi:hypothetical protein